MNRLKNYENIISDANIIIYYCFNTKETRILELTDKTHRLFNFLINNNIKIRTPKFIINEINRIDFSKKIDEMIAKKELINIPKDTGNFIKMKLESKIVTVKNSTGFIYFLHIFLAHFVPSI